MNVVWDVGGGGEWEGKDGLDAVLHSILVLSLLLLLGTDWIADCQFLFCEVTFLSFSFKTKQSLISFEGCVSVRENNIVICYNHILLLLLSSFLNEKVLQFCHNCRQ